MHSRVRVAAMAALCLAAAGAQASEVGFGACSRGFNPDTRVQTEARGVVTIDEVQVDDRVWSMNEIIGKPGWSRILRRVDAGNHYKLLADFTEPGDSKITKACWHIRR